MRRTHAASGRSLIRRDGLGDDTEAFIIEARAEGLVGADEFNRTITCDGGFHAHAPVGGVDDESPQAGAPEVIPAAHGGLKDAGFLTAAGPPSLEPRHRQGFELRVGRIIVLPSHERLAPDERRAATRQAAAFFVGAVHIGVAPDIFYPAENGVIFLTLDDEATGRVSVVASMMPAETATEDVFPPFDLLAIDLVRQLGVEPVIGRAQGNEGFAGIHILHDELSLRHGQRE